MRDRPTVLYFDIRGRAEPIRMVLEFLGVDYEDKQIIPEQWESIRATTPFGRLPVYTEGELVIPETFAILSHLARKHGLRGATELDCVRCDVTVEAWRDHGNRVANAFGALSRSEDARTQFVNEEQPALLADLEAYYLQRDTRFPFWAGASPTIGDFCAFHQIDGLARQFPETLPRFGALEEFHRLFSAQPKIKAYLGSPRRPAALFYGPNGRIFAKD